MKKNLLKTLLATIMVGVLSSTPALASTQALASTPIKENTPPQNEILQTIEFKPGETEKIVTIQGKDLIAATRSIGINRNYNPYVNMLGILISTPSTIWGKKNIVVCAYATKNNYTPANFNCRIFLLKSGQDAIITTPHMDIKSFNTSYTHYFTGISPNDQYHFGIRITHYPNFPDNATTQVVIGATAYD